jgi:iron complex transport system substrate-binding protein
MDTRAISSRLVLACLLALLAFLAACGGTSAVPTASQPTPTPAVDVYGTPIVVPTVAPQRIVSLVPSTSEILAALNLQDHVVGVDFYTNYPAAMAALPKVSNANGDYNVEQIVALKPDLILSYGAETKQYDTQLKNLHLDVVDLPLSNLAQTLQEILVVGQLTHTVPTATALVRQMQQQINQVKSAVASKPAPTVLLEVDDSSPGKPYVFGGTSFGDQLAQIANAINIFHNNSSNGGYPQVTDEAIISANPQYVILTEDPAYGGNPNAVYQRPNWGGITAIKDHHVYRINADIMQRPGPRIVEGLRCLAQIVHPDAFTGPLPDYCTGTV